MYFTRPKAIIPLLLLASVLSSVSLTNTPSHASAVSADSGSGTASGSVSGDAIEAEVQFTAPIGTDTSSCKWRPVLATSQGSRSGKEPVNVVGADGVSRSLYWKYCENGATGYYWIRDDVSARTEVAAHDKVSKLLKMLVTMTAPPMTKQVVNVGTWFWVPRQLWVPLIATAYIVLPYAIITVTTTATPMYLSYTPGDGHKKVKCNGPGTPWNPMYGDTAKSPCMYTYKSASHTKKSHTYDSQMAVTWKVTWKSNLAAGGTIGYKTISIHNTARVFEMQALAQ